MSSPDVTITTQTSLITAVVFIVLAYVLSFTISFTTKSWLFHLDIIYIPHITSSILGLINIIYNKSIRRTPNWTDGASVAVALAAISILGYTIAALLTLRKLHMVRVRDATHRLVSSKSTSDFLPETELQRQQLLRLLLQQEETQAASPQTSTQHTFKIDLPGGVERTTARNTMHNLRNLPFTSRLGSRAPSVYGAGAPAPAQLPADEQTGNGPEMGLPTIIVEEATVPRATEPNPSPLRAVRYERPFSYQPTEPVPTYQQHASSPRNSSPNAPQLQENGYPIEKPDIILSTPDQERDSTRRNERPLNGYTVIDSAQVAEKAQRPARGTSNRVRERENRRTEIELADRAKYGTRNRQELEGEAIGLGLSGSIRRVETDGWAR